MSFPVFAAVVRRFSAPEDAPPAPQPQHAGTSEPPVVATVAAMLMLRESTETDLIPDAVLDALSTARCSEPRCGIAERDLRVTTGAVLLRLSRAARPPRLKLRLTPALPPTDAAAAQLAIARGLLHGRLAELCVSRGSAVLQMP